MEDTTAIKSGVYPMIDKALSTKSAAYKRVVNNFLNARAEELYAIAPYDRIPFGIDDSNEFFKALGISENDIKNHISKTYYAKMAAFNPAAAKDSFTIAMMMVVRYYFLKGMNKELEMSCIYLAFSGKFYPSIHYGSYPKVQPSEYKYIMDYVINNELSQKFDIKREGSVIGAVRSICRTWIESYKKLFRSCSDEDVTYLIQQLHNRIKSFMKNIATLYYKAYDNKDTFTYSSDNYEKDGFRIADSDSLKGDRYVSNTMTYISTRSVDYRICKLSADNLVKTDELKTIIESIHSDNSNMVLIRELITITVLEYLQTSTTKDVTGIDFITFSISSKPNTKNPNIIRQKDIIIKLLNENSPHYIRRKNREATANSYHKSVLKYYTLMINQANK